MIGARKVRKVAPSNEHGLGNVCDGGCLGRRRLVANIRIHHEYTWASYVQSEFEDPGFFCCEFWCEAGSGRLLMVGPGPSDKARPEKRGPGLTRSLGRSRIRSAGYSLMKYDFTILIHQGIDGFLLIWKHPRAPPDMLNLVAIDIFLDLITLST